MPWIWPRRAVQVADDVAHVIVGDDDGDLHDGLQQARDLPCGMASLKAMEPAILKAISEESTS